MAGEGIAKAVVLVGIVLVVFVFVIAIFNLVLSSLKAMRLFPLNPALPLGFALGFTILVVLLLLFIALLLAIYDALEVVGSARGAGYNYWY